MKLLRFFHLLWAESYELRISFLQAMLFLGILFSILLSVIFFLGLGTYYLLDLHLYAHIGQPADRIVWPVAHWFDKILGNGLVVFCYIFFTAVAGVITYGVLFVLIHFCEWLISKWKSLN